MGVDGWAKFQGLLSKRLETVLTVATTVLRFCRGDQKLPVKWLNRCQVGAG